MVAGTTLPPRPRAPRLARNVVFNLLGQAIPLAAALFAIPMLIRGLGTERFGVLTLTWMVIGYFSLFDLGLSRALTQVVSASLALENSGRAPAVVWPALGLMGALGLVGALTLAAIAPWLAESAIKIPPSLRPETLTSFYVLAVGIPIVVVTAGLIGILSAFQRFGVLNAIRAPLGIYTFVAPLAVLPISSNLVLVTVVLVLGRLAACMAHAAACRHLMPSIPPRLMQSYGEVRALFHFGAWMTVSNVIGPLMVYLDRFVIGATLSVAAVAYYATPYEMVTKLLLIPGAVAGVLFPAFTLSYSQDRPRLSRLFVRGTKYVAVIQFPAMLLVVAFAPEGLRVWLGDEFSRQSAPVLRWLAIGVFINGAAQLFATMIQSAGRPDLTAKLHAIELPLYLSTLWWAIHSYGILGAAIAWTLRVAVDCAVLLWLSSRFFGDMERPHGKIAMGLGVALIGMAAPALLPGVGARAVAVLLEAVLFAVGVWMLVLADDERQQLKLMVSYP